MLSSSTARVFFKSVKQNVNRSTALTLPVLILQLITTVASLSLQFWTLDLKCSLFRKSNWPILGKAKFIQVQSNSQRRMEVNTVRLYPSNLWGGRHIYIWSDCLSLVGEDVRFCLSLSRGWSFHWTHAWKWSWLHYVSNVRAGRLHVPPGQVTGLQAASSKLI